MKFSMVVTSALLVGWSPLQVLHVVGGLYTFRRQHRSQAQLNSVHSKPDATSSGFFVFISGCACYGISRLWWEEPDEISTGRRRRAAGRMQPASGPERRGRVSQLRAPHRPA